MSRKTATAPDIGDSAQAASEAVKEAKGKQGRDMHHVELSTGVVMKINRVPPMLMTDIMSSLSRDRPKPPKVFIESKGREEENPDDPDYQEELQSYNARLASAMTDAFVLTGSEIEKKPKGMPGPDDAKFLSRMRILDRPVEDEDQRYLAWVKYMAAVEPDDITELLGAIGRLSGVSEGDVQAAVQNFRSPDEREADS